MRLASQSKRRKRKVAALALLQEKGCAKGNDFRTTATRFLPLISNSRKALIDMRKMLSPTYTRGLGSKVGLTQQAPFLVRLLVSTHQDSIYKKGQRGY
ncbi:hypothetical protein H5410_039675 [Solanum commersonii]|uniref:Uncharacterized protein n=1 Tax=Solanum commersonii TaxID=4109 RepID=A0A9J5XLM5_SOLCO|nr:hypothetical protein H5410_039675 [Solanum commersonii]